MFLFYSGWMGKSVKRKLNLIAQENHTHPHPLKSISDITKNDCQKKNRMIWSEKKQPKMWTEISKFHYKKINRKKAKQTQGMVWFAVVVIAKAFV